jgi:hypothetical protein
MESETAAASGRPRRWLLIALGIVIVVLIASWMWPTGSATPPPAASNQGRASQPDAARVDPAALKVRLETLSAARPEPSAAERNPFGFKPAPPPPPPPAPPRTTPEVPIGPATPPTPPPPPPIPLKFSGIVEKNGVKFATLCDGRSIYFGAEGDIIDGRYRLVRIGVESIVMEYVDGRGKSTIRLEGCSPR